MLMQLISIIIPSQSSLVEWELMYSVETVVAWWVVRDKVESAITVPNISVM